ncbi:MAG: DUF1361 domain-containing protein [Bacteroidetes bacterium]|nr:MAG: DUF1361 domain-containing protein [Bacteroidota bacterium]
MKLINHSASILRPSPKQKILYLLVLSTLFNGLMLMFRLYKTEALGMPYDWHVSKVTGSPWIFMFLVWNLFLAWIPFLIAYNLEGIHNRFGRILSIPALLLWLLFLPNAPYIITDLIHLRVRPPLPLWYDTTMLFAFAWTGMMLGFFSLLYARYYWEKFIHQKTTGLFVFGSLAMCSLGIYIGRFQRWNSWDILVNPGSLLQDVFQIMINPFENLRYFGITFIFFCLLSLGYLMFKTLIKHHE